MGESGEERAATVGKGSARKRRLQADAALHRGYSVPNACAVVASRVSCWGKQKVRLAFKIGGVEFEDVRVNFPDWAALKPKTPFGQLPFMNIDDAEPVAQSGAMLRCGDCGVSSACALSLHRTPCCTRARARTYARTESARPLQVRREARQTVP